MLSPFFASPMPVSLMAGSLTLMLLFCPATEVIAFNSPSLMVTSLMTTFLPAAFFSALASLSSPAEGCAAS